MRADPAEEVAFLKTLKAIRVDAGLSQAQLASAIGVPQSFVSKYESGERRLTLIEVRTLCGAVGIDLNRFIELFEHNLRDQADR